MTQQLAINDVISSGKNSYTITSSLGGDDVADRYRAHSAASSAQVLLKVARETDNNTFLRAEAAALSGLNQRGEAKLAAYAPELFESFDTAGDDGLDRTVNVMTDTSSFVSLARVAQAFPDGLDARDVAWMWRRLLVAVGYAHRAGIIHTAVIPENVLVEPAQHGLVLTNWYYAQEAPNLVAASGLFSGRMDIYAPEILDGEQVNTTADIFMATRTISSLFDNATSQHLTNFARGCMLDSPVARPDDAWELLKELDGLLEQLFGPRRFRPFAMPTRDSSMASK